MYICICVCCYSSSSRLAVYVSSIISSIVLIVKVLEECMFSPSGMVFSTL